MFLYDETFHNDIHHIHIQCVTFMFLIIIRYYLRIMKSKNNDYEINYCFSMKNSVMANYYEMKCLIIII